MFTNLFISHLAGNLFYFFFSRQTTDTRPNVFICSAVSNRREDVSALTSEVHPGGNGQLADAPFNPSTQCAARNASS